MENKIDFVLDQALAYINIRKNNLQISDLQIANIDINIKGGASESLLQNATIEAATTEDVKREKLCIALIKFLIKNKEKNAIDYAAIGGKTKNLKLLFSHAQKNGIQKEEIQDLKNNALYYAVKEGCQNQNAIAYLIKNGADINHQNKNNKTVLHIALDKLQSKPQES